MKQRSRSISRGWLVRLRLGAAASKLAIALVVHFALGIALPIAAICVLVAIEALSNVLLRSREPTLSPRVVLGGVEHQGPGRQACARGAG